MKGIKFIRLIILDMSTQDVGNILNVSKSSVSEWELGANKMSDINKRKLFKITNIDTNWYEKDLTKTDMIKILEQNEILYSDIKKRIGKVIYKNRLQKKMTQKQLAEKLNVSTGIITTYEKGLKTPSDELKLEICNIFNISLDNLFGVN